MCLAAGGSVEGEILIYWYIYYVLLDSGQHIILSVVWCNCKYLLWSSSHYDEAIGGFAKRAHPARARYINVNLARRNRDLQPGGKEIEEGGGGGGEEEKEEEEKEAKEEKSDSW